MKVHLLTLVLFVELLYQVKCAVRQLHTFVFIVQMEQCVLELLSPVEITALAVLVLMG